MVHKTGILVLLKISHKILKNKKKNRKKKESNFYISMKEAKYCIFPLAILLFFIVTLGNIEK